jgi:hypothetical protein
LVCALVQLSLPQLSLPTTRPTNLSMIMTRTRMTTLSQVIPPGLRERMRRVLPILLRHLSHLQLRPPTHSRPQIFPMTRPDQISSHLIWIMTALRQIY